MYLQGVLPWKSAKWEAPPPEEIARIRKEAGTHDDMPVEGNDIAPAGQRGSTMSESTDVEKEGEQEPKEHIPQA